MGDQSPKIIERYMGVTTSFDLVGTAHRYYVDREGQLKPGTVRVLHRYGIKRFADLGVDVSQFDCEVMYDEDSEYFHLAYDNCQGLMFKIGGIMMKVNNMGIHLDHGIDMEEGSIHD